MAEGSEVPTASVHPVVPGGALHSFLPPGEGGESSASP